MRGSDRLSQMRLLPVQVGPWLRARSARHRYRILDEHELRARRRSDTVFVFGSGASLNEIAPEDWARIAEHDTFGFNWFVHQRFVRCDFHLVRGIPDADLDRHVWEPQVREYGRLIAENPLFADTVFCIQEGLRAINGNRLLGFGLLPRSALVFPWRTRIGRIQPGASFAEGLTHRFSTLAEVVNLAFLAGWERIVLTGVDLYDRRYFWLPDGESRTVDLRRGATAVDSHVQASSGVVDLLGVWAAEFARSGVSVEVHNPASLLARVLPVYRPAREGS